MRIGGLASGMDTDSMVKELMKAENVKVDKIKAEKQIIEWRKESLNSINKDFANFVLDTKKDFGYNNLGRPGNMNWHKTVTSSDENSVSVSAKSGVVSGNHTIEVKKLADGVKGGSAKEIEGNTLFGPMNFEINGKKVEIAANSKISDVVDKINSAKTGVTASYDSSTKKFFIQTNNTGAKDGELRLKTLDGISNSFFNDMELHLSSSCEYNTDTIPVPENGVYTSRKVTLVAGTERTFVGVDAEIIYNGLTLKQSSNSFDLNGMSLTIKKIDTVNINVTTDTDKVVEKVKAFINNYNIMIEKAGNAINEKQNRNYKPLSDEQREAMSDKEIEIWEKKAKSGLINGDSDITKTISSMRTMLYKDVKGNFGEFKYMENGVAKTTELKNITQLGITTQKYKSGAMGGQLELDEDKLRDVLSYNLDGVMGILFNEDSKYATEDDNILAKNNLTLLEQEESKDKFGKKDMTQLDKKRSNSGMITRIFDEMVVGMKGIIAKSGPGDEIALYRNVKSNMMTEFVTSGGRYSKQGSISDLEHDMFRFTKKIDDLNVYLFKKENSYYAKFTAMEQAMQRSSSQSGWLAQQFGGGN